MRIVLAEEAVYAERKDVFKGIALGTLVVIIIAFVVVGVVILIIIAPQAEFIRIAASMISKYLTFQLP